MGKFLIIADPKDSCFATPRGLELAANLGQQADVVAFVHAPLRSLKVTSAQQARMKKLLLKEREAAVRERIKKYKKPGQKVNLTVVWEKDTVSWVNRRCAKGAYRWVVKTAGAESVVGSANDWQLLRECRAPVLLVADKKWHDTKPVLAALDLASDSPRKRALNRKVLRSACDMAQTLGVEMKVITAIEVPTLLTDLDLVEPGAYAADAKAAMQPQIQKLAKEFDLSPKAFIVKRGPVEKVITSTAAKVRAQVVVMGTVGRTGVRARLLGNCAEKVLEHLRTDVLAIKPG